MGEDNCFRAEGLSRSGWSNATPIRKIFKHAFASAGLAYANPHSFRKTLAQLGQRTCRTPEEFKAWSQNLGHEQVLTTLASYGQVAYERQVEIIRGIGRMPTGTGSTVRRSIRSCGTWKAPNTGRRWSHKSANPAAMAERQDRASQRSGENRAGRPVGHGWHELAHPDGCLGCDRMRSDVARGQAIRIVWRIRRRTSSGRFGHKVCAAGEASAPRAPRRWPFRTVDGGPRACRAQARAAPQNPRQ